MELRPYQQDCISTIETQPPGSYLVQMATGLGKTVTFANLPRHGERMLILSHREELVEQPRKYFDCTYGALTEQVFSMPGAEERYQRWKSERVKKAANANSTSETGVLA